MLASPRIMAVHVEAPIAGTILRVLVKPGDRVAAGQQVLVIESMKMEMPIEAMTGGTVGSIEVEAGQAVEDGAILLTIV